MTSEKCSRGRHRRRVVAWHCCCTVLEHASSNGQTGRFAVAHSAPPQARRPESPDVVAVRGARTERRGRLSDSVGAGQRLGARISPAPRRRCECSRRRLRRRPSCRDGHAHRSGSVHDRRGPRARAACRARLRFRRATARRRGASGPGHEAGAPRRAHDPGVGSQAASVARRRGRRDRVHRRPSADARHRPRAGRRIGRARGDPGPHANGSAHDLRRRLPSPSGHRVQRWSPLRGDRRPPRRADGGRSRIRDSDPARRARGHREGARIPR